MAWFVLVLSGVLEAVWATALGRSQGFTRLVPSLVFLVAVIASMVGLAHALRSLPIGTAYAVWVGIGAVGTALYAIVVDGEPASVLKILCLLGIIACVAGLKIAS
jgi:quaternary ammonium compound-resistance protein SugE